MRRILHIALVTTAVALLMVSCSDGRSGSPLIPSVTPPDVRSTASANRHLIGFWDVSISEDRSSAVVVQVRSAQTHLNVLHILEKGCDNCLIINNVKVLPSGELSADLILRHPFPGLPRNTGFDVRGILIAGSDYEFPASGRRIALGDECLRLVNAEGYTTLFNPTGFPVNQDLPYVFQYTEGEYSQGDGPFDATLNPYLAYSRDKPRRMFAVGTSETRTVILDTPPGELQFGYAVDASWVPVAGPVTDPLTDFPPEANCIEAYEVSVAAGEVTEQTGGKGHVEVWAYDHQGMETIESVTLEVPDLFAGEFALGYTGDAPDGAAIFTGWVPNTFAAPEGEYLMLVRVRDTATDPNLGPIDAWQLSAISVGEGLPGWARTWGGESDDRGFGVAVDGWGNIYTTGFFRDTVDFDPGPGEDYHTATSYYGAFLSKFDPEGNFQWARTWGPLTDTTSIGSRDVVVTPSGDVYVTGYYHGICDFDPSPGEDFHQSASEDKHDTFLSKFDTDGNFLWVRVWGSADWDQGNALAVDNTGNVYVTGDFEDTVDFDPGDGVDEHTAGSNNGHVFLSKFDTNGGFLWARTWGGGSATVNRGYGTAADDLGNVFVTGVFAGVVDFDPGPGEDIQQGENNNNAFLSKFDDSGNFLWARTWGTKTEGWAKGNDIATNSIGDSFILGGLGGTVDFDPGPGEDIHSADNIFLTSFDTDGDFRWARTWADSNGAAGRGVAFHESGNIYVTGTFWGLYIDFDPGPGEDLHSANSSLDLDIFLSKFSYDGDFFWARTWGGSSPGDIGQDVAVNSSQSAYVTGNFSDLVDFDPGPGEDIHDGGHVTDAFLTKILPDGYW